MRNLICYVLIPMMAINYVFGQRVNLKNGNCYVSYDDISFKKYDGLKKDFLVRTYNSKSTEKGWFGFGWGSKLESNLTFYPDYTVVIKEHGAGGKSMFKSGIQDDQLTEEMVETIIDVEIEEGILRDVPEAVNKRLDELKRNKTVQLAVYSKYVRKGYLEPFSEIPEGITWQSFARGNDYKLVFENGRFIRSSRSGQKEYYDLDGNMTRIEDVDGNRLDLTYAGTFPKSISSPGDFKLEFETNENGHITKIRNSDGQEAILKYESDNLIYAQDSEGNQYGYEYDDHHNLTAIIYNPVRFKGEPIDATYIEYTPKTLYTSKITKRDGEVTEYRYKNFYTEEGKEDKDHYATTVIKEGWNGEKVENYYEYLIGTSADGSRYTKEIITGVNGINTRTVYHEKCSAPIRIERGNRWVNMVFDKDCNMVEKEYSNGDHLKLEYHPVLKKLTRVEQGNDVNVFEYNDKGQVTYARKNEGTPIALIYNEVGKIIKIENGDKNLVLSYNKAGKPIKISQEGYGHVDITYDEYGDIDQVKSEDGHKMALQITSTFQNLLGLVKVPNVNYQL